MIDLVESSCSIHGHHPTWFPEYPEYPENPEKYSSSLENPYNFLDIPDIPESVGGDDQNSVAEGIFWHISH